MSSPSPSATRKRGPTAGPVVFEHPLSERIRSFLRLETVLADARQRLVHPEPAISRAALGSLLELASLTERGELKREILSELERQRIVLSQLRENAEIDSGKLDETLSRLGREQDAVEALGNALGHGLKTNEFLSAIRSRSAIPGGTCSFDLPSLHCWLMRPAEERQRDLARWLDQLEPVERALAIILEHTRGAASPEQTVARGGIYEYVPPSDNPPVLLRVLLPAQSRLFPLVSAGRQRITIQFQRWHGTQSRAETLREDVPFALALCRL